MNSDNTRQRITRIARLWIGLSVITLISLGCSGSGEILEGEVNGQAHGPFTKADGTDAPDFGCIVVLRDVNRLPTDPFSGDQWARWQGTYDVAQTAISQDGSSTGVLYRSSSNPSYNSVQGTATGGAPPGYQRYTFLLFDQTLAPREVDMASPFDGTNLDLIPYVKTRTGRLLDHNVIGNSSQAYRLTAPNFAYRSNASVCAASGTTGDAPDWVGEVIVQSAQPFWDPCEGGSPFTGEHTISDSQSGTSDASVHVCLQVNKTGITDQWNNPEAADSFDVRLYYRFDRDGEFRVNSFSFHQVVGQNAQYKFNLRTLNPFEGAGCPENTVDLEYQESDFNMWALAEFYMTVNGQEVRPEHGEVFQGKYGAFPIFDCLP